MKQASFQGLATAASMTLNRLDNEQKDLIHGSLLTYKHQAFQSKKHSIYHLPRTPQRADHARPWLPGQMHGKAGLSC
jgi:hypothetical protein